MNEDTIRDYTDAPLTPGDLVVDPNGGIWTVQETAPSIWRFGRGVTCLSKKGQKKWHLRQVLIIKVTQEEINAAGDNLKQLFNDKAEFTRRTRRADLSGRRRRLDEVLDKRGLRR